MRQKYRILLLLVGSLLSLPALAVNGGINTKDRDIRGLDRMLDYQQVRMGDQITINIRTEKVSSSTMVIDRSTQAVYIAAGSANVQAYSFSQLATLSYPNNPNMQASFINQLNTAAFQTPRALFGGFSGSYTGIPLPCQLSPCARGWQNGYGSWSEWAPIVPNVLDLSMWDPQVIAIDRAAFERATREACKEAHGSGVDNAILMVGTVGSCLAIGSGGGAVPAAVGCGAGAAGVVRSITRQGDAEHRCHHKNNYPGPGKW
jgi:hypothetical protein